MSNRAERRRIARNQQKQVDQFRKLSLVEQQASLARNGITPQYLEQKCNEFYKKGLSDGAGQAAKMMQETCYEAFVLGLHEKYGFGPDRCMDVLTLTNSYILELTDMLESAVAMKCRLKIDFSDLTSPEIRKLTSQEYKELMEKLNGNSQAD